jgi:hypothetical protein
MSLVGLGQAQGLLGIAQVAAGLGDIGTRCLQGILGRGQAGRGFLVAGGGGGGTATGILQQEIPARRILGQLALLAMPVGVLDAQLIQARFQPRARIAQMADLGFEAADFGIGREHFGLRRMQGVRRRIMALARMLDTRLDFAQLRRLRLDAIDGFIHIARQALAVLPGVVALLQPEQGLLARHALVQVAILLRHGRLRLQMADLRFQFVANVLDAGQVLAGILQPVLGFLAALLVLGDAGSFFEEQAQIVRLGLDDAGNHALTDDGVGAGAKAGAQEEVDHVAAPDVQVVDVVAGVAFPVEHALDGDFGVLAPLAGGLAHMVVEEQLDAGAADFLAGAGALEDHILDRLTAQFGGLGFAQHPAHRVDDVRFATAIGPDDARQLPRKEHRGGIDKGFETGEFELGKTHEG